MATAGLVPLGKSGPCSVSTGIAASTTLYDTELRTQIGL